MMLPPWTRSIFVIGWLASAACVLTGCESPGALYQPPPGLTAETSATILGSKFERFLLAPDDHVFISAIDGLRTGLSFNDEQTPVLLTPGSHMVGIGFKQHDKWGSIATQIDVEPGKTYVAHCRAGVWAFTAKCSIDESATGATVIGDLVLRLDNGSLIPLLINGK
jgi:hypothetical protein